MKNVTMKREDTPYITSKVMLVQVDNPKLTLRDKLFAAFRLAEARLKPHGPFLSPAEIEKELSGLLEDEQ